MMSKTFAPRYILTEEIEERLAQIAATEERLRVLEQEVRERLDAIERKVQQIVDHSTRSEAHMREVRAHMKTALHGE